jgi:hypothetical protein
MLGHFPPPYPDELLYSVLARYNNRLPMQSTKKFAQNALGRTTATAVVDLPSHLSDLVASLPTFMGVTMDRLIDQNTLWPFFAAFHDPERRKLTRDEMQRNGHAYLTLGMMASRAAWPTFLRYCPICLQENRKKFYEAYWHRAHQVPGIEVCHLHNIWLVDSSVPFRHSRNRHEYCSAEASLAVAPVDCASPISDVQLALAQDAAWLLNHPETSIPSEQLRNAILYKLATIGYANYRGHLQNSRLLQDFAAKYSPNWLASIHCELPDSGETWIERLLRKPRGNQHTTRYLLLAHFVGICVPALIEEVQTPHPFGTAPWPCLNRAADHYAKLTVPECGVAPARNGRKLIGTFYCPDCGMTYERVGPDQQVSDRMHRELIPCYGPVWDEALLRLWPDPSVSLRELSRRLGVDSITVKRQTLRLGLPAERPGHRNGAEVRPSTIPRLVSMRDVDECKDLWLKLRNEHPAATRTTLRKALPPVHAVLRRHASDWLEQNSPKPVSPRSDCLRADWKARDIKLIQQVRTAAERLQSRTPLVRLTSTAILREAGCIWAMSSRKFPLLSGTFAALEYLAESRVTFAVRRVYAAAKRAAGPIQQWKLARIAGLRPDLIHNPEVQHALELASKKTIEAATDTRSVAVVAQGA